MYFWIMFRAQSLLAKQTTVQIQLYKLKLYAFSDITSIFLIRGEMVPQRSKMRNIILKR